jgi:hypothetical protein
MSWDASKPKGMAWLVREWDSVVVKNARNQISNLHKIDAINCMDGKKPDQFSSPRKIFVNFPGR